jgi:four helix bundle protein
MENYRKHRDWVKCHQLALDVIKASVSIPGRDYLALRTDMIRAAMSISANAVEGARQKSGREFARHIRISISSASELESHLATARDIGALNDSEFERLSSQTVEVRKMFHDLLGSALKAVEAESSKATM